MGPHELRVEIRSGGKDYVALYKNFKLESESNNYRIRLGAVSSDIDDGTNGLSYANGMFFTTFDRDNDEVSWANCAIWNESGWWFKDCHRARSVYDLLPSNTNLVRCGKKQDLTCPLCQGRQTTEYVLSSCKITLSQGRYTWRHNRVLPELAAIISKAKAETTLPNTNALIFTTEGGTKSWHGRPVRTTNQIKCLLHACDDWDVSANLPEFDNHPSIIKATRRRPDSMIHSAFTQHLIMMELTGPYENRMEEAHIYKREKYLNVTKELENAGYKAVVMPVEVGAKRFVGSSVYNLLTKLSICGNKRTKDLKLLAENSRK
ncbi:hypothetical protein RRG08_026830 [Elysia crispata]|uniref:Fibrinogen C-terminal domain-containing protein n=1 Tax=Elysia crispata TaxID=231223 RepID=A0AAE0ZIB7_9GAST|nr:hypothetical protein RRG08_026830 [Elysia crispata]